MCLSLLCIVFMETRLFAAWAVATCASMGRAYVLFHFSELESGRGGRVSHISALFPLFTEKFTLRPGAPGAPNPSKVTLVLMSQCCLPTGKRLIPDLSAETLEKAEEDTLCSPPTLGSGGVPNCWLASWSNYTPCPGHCPHLILPKKLQGIREESGHPYQVSHPSLGRSVPSARGDRTRSPTIPSSEGSCPLTSESSGLVSGYVRHVLAGSRFPTPFTAV